MPSYLVETYLSRGNAGERLARERRARSAAEELTRGSTPVRFDRSIHILEDEICFFVFDAVSSRDAELAAQCAELAPIRVVEAVSSGEEQTLMTVPQQQKGTAMNKLVTSQGSRRFERSLA